MRDRPRECEISSAQGKACQSARCSAGLCFLLSGNMSFGIVGSELMVRVGHDAYPEALTLRHAARNGLHGRTYAGHGVRFRGWHLRG